MNFPVPISSSQYYLGIQYGYIILPSGIDRDTFIQQCYRWERVSVLAEGGGGVLHECYISREAIKDIEFPQTIEQLGSCVSFLTDIHSAHPIIFGVFSKEDESQLLREGYFEWSKKNGNDSVTISGDAKRGVLNLSVDGGTLTQLNITVSNKAKNAVVNLRCRGDINLQMDGAFKINKGTEPMVKGSELETQLEKNNDLLQAIIDILTGTVIDEPGSGSPSALQAALKTAIGSKVLGVYSHIKSLESSLD
jgi:hypothetical protein